MTAARVFCLPAILLAVGSAPAADPPPTAIAPKTVTLANRSVPLAEMLADIAKQTGIAVTADGVDGTRPVTAGFEGTPFWSALDQLAARTDSQLTLRDRGRNVVLTPRPGRPAPPASSDGPFRVAVRQVVAKTDFDTGRTVYEVGLDVHWEPRFPVFRIDTDPTITALADDRGTQLRAPAVRAKTPPTGFHHVATVRIDGVPRSATKLTKLAGTFTVTASERMLPFTFADLTATAAQMQERDGVSVTLQPLRKLAERWDIELVLRYPPAQPVFESFESWVSENRLRLVAPTGKVHEPRDYDFPEQDRRVVAVYRFSTTPGKGPPLGDRRGWSLTYDTPAPLVEFPVSFTLTDIALP